MSYSPDRWVVLKVTPEDKDPWYRLFGGWYGNFVNGDSWRLNSGITRVELVGDVYEVHGESGSVYKCHSEAEGLSGYMDSVLDSFQYNAAERGAKVEVVTIGEYLEAK